MEQELQKEAYDGILLSAMSRDTFVKTHFRIFSYTSQFRGGCGSNPQAKHRLRSIAHDIASRVGITYNSERTMHDSGQLHYVGSELFRGQ